MNLSFERLKAKYRYTYILLRQLVITDFKLRYQGSVLGYMWSLLRPLALFSILYIVFAKVIGVGRDLPYFASYLLMGIVLWNFFVEITSGSIGSVVARGDLLRKLSFPKYVIVLSVSFSATINLLLNLVVLAVIMAIQGVPLRATMLLAPLYIAEIYTFALGIGLFLAAAYVKYRDINYIWEVVMQAAFYATPIIYSIKLIVDKSKPIAELLMMNPIAHAIQGMRSVVISDSTVTFSDLSSNWALSLVPIVVVTITFVLGAAYFRSRSRFFAEEI